MKKYSLVRKYLTIGVVFFFIGTGIVPSIQSEISQEKNIITVDDEPGVSELTHEKNIITVDDEPGDADFTSIKEAVNSSNPGDIIEVYSGTYLEQGIHIVKDNIALLGISYELGEGNDSGLPFIKGNGTIAAIWVEASQVIISNFTIENPYNHTYYHTGGIYVGKDFPPFELDDIIISNCIIYNTTWGIYVARGENIRIIDNNISHCILGIDIDFSMNFITTGNVITDCRRHGIYLYGPIFNRNFSGNRIRNCKYGIDFGGKNNIFYGNDFENCSIGIRSGAEECTFTKNNFKNYSRIGFWFYKPFLYPTKNRWIGNYWDTWKGVGPKIILGSLVFGWRFVEYGFPLIPIPWVDFDWHPAKEPYDIP